MTTRATKKKVAAPEDKPSNTLLADIYQTMGRVEGQNELIIAEQGRATAGRKDLHDAISGTRRDIAAVAYDVALIEQSAAAVEKRVANMEPVVGRMAGFRLQLGLAVVFATSVVTGACNLVYYAFSHFSEIKTALRELMR